ncbi:MAG: deoxyribonuclease IV, partial [Enterococcus sp.]|nr:deoxyribonuclease IV [Enterococcus sp.]
ETPYVGKEKKTAYAPYGKEITMFKTQVFDPEAFPELLLEESK